MNNEEFEEFYIEYYEFSVRIAEKVAKNRTLAEDISQEVFCSLYKVKQKLEKDNEKKSRALVVKATVNKARDFQRKTYAKQEIAGLEDSDHSDRTKCSISAEEAVLGLERRENLQMIFERLRTESRMNYDIFVAVKILDIPPKTVAAEFHMTRNSVNNRILRTRHWLWTEYTRIYKDAL